MPFVPILPSSHTPEPTGIFGVDHAQSHQEARRDYHERTITQEQITPLPPQVETEKSSVQGVAPGSTGTSSLHPPPLLSDLISFSPPTEGQSQRHSIHGQHDGDFHFAFQQDGQVYLNEPATLMAYQTPSTPIRSLLSSSVGTRHILSESVPMGAYELSMTNGTRSPPSDSTPLTPIMSNAESLVSPPLAHRHHHSVHSSKPLTTDSPQNSINVPRLVDTRELEPPVEPSTSNPSEPVTCKPLASPSEGGHHINIDVRHDSEGMTTRVLSPPSCLSSPSGSVDYVGMGDVPLRLNQSNRTNTNSSFKLTQNQSNTTTSHQSSMGQQTRATSPTKPLPQAGASQSGKVADLESTKVEEVEMPRSKWPRRRRCPFSFWLSFTSSLLIALTTVLVSYVAYHENRTFSYDLMDTMRDVVWKEVRNQLIDQLQHGLEIATTLEFMMPMHFTDVGNRTTVTKRSGFLTPFLLCGKLNPGVIAMGFVNQYNLILDIQKLHATTKEFDAVEGMVISVAEPYVDEDGQVNRTRPVLVNSYIPTPMEMNNQHEHSALLIVYLAPTASPATTMKFLGTPISSVEISPFVPMIDGYVADLRRSGLTTSWTLPEPHVFLYSSTTFATPVNVLRVISRLESPDITAAIAADEGLGRSAIVYTDLDLRVFEQILADLEIGDSGIGYMYSPRGVIVASSDEQYVAITRIPPQTGTLAYNALQFMFDCHLITTDLTVDDLNIYFVLNQSSTPCERDFDYEGESYRFQGMVLSPTETGLPYSFAMLSKDGEVGGDTFHQSVGTIGWSATLLACVAIALSIILSRLLTRPIRVVAESMKSLIAAFAIEDTEQRKSAIHKLYVEWHILADRADGNHSTDSPLPMSLSDVSIAETEVRASKKKYISFPTHEVHLMQQAYASMLHTMTTFDTLRNVNDAKKRFIRYIFHEVRVPFNAMVLAIGQFQSDIAPYTHLMPDAVDTLQILQEQSDVVVHILNDVLSLQKIEDGALTLEYKVFDMNRMIRSTLLTFKNACQERSQEMKMKLTNLNHVALKRLQSAQELLDVARVKSLSKKSIQFGVVGDVHRLRQVLSNYVSNAVKFSPRGKQIRVTVSFDDIEFHPAFLASLSGMNSTATRFSSHSIGCVVVRLVVSDQGCGIPEAHQGNLWKAYMQINAGTIQKSKGSGLGLSVSKSIIELHGGTVDVESHEGIGSEFSFTLPMKLHLVLPNDRQLTDEHSETSQQPVERRNSRSLEPSTPIDNRTRTLANGMTPKTNDAAGHRMLSMCARKAQSSGTVLTIHSSDTASTDVSSITDNTLSNSLKAVDTKTLASVRRMSIVRELSDGGSSKMSNAPSPDANTENKHFSHPVDITRLHHQADISRTDSILAPFNSVVLPIRFPEPKLPTFEMLTEAPLAVETMLEQTPPSLARRYEPKVLVVEDSAPNRKLLCALLKRLKCSVSQAEDGQKCLDYFEPIFRIFTNLHPGEEKNHQVSLVDMLSPFDIILMDNTMPVMDGVTATRLLREHGFTKPIIGVTGNCLEEDLKLFRESGANEILTKPISAAKLERVLRQYAPPLGKQIFDPPSSTPAQTVEISG